MSKRNKYIDRIATGDRIKERMDQKGISTKEMAAILGVSFQSVYAYIHGYRLPNITHLLNISYALGTSINDLLVPRSDADLDLPVI